MSLIRPVLNLFLRWIERPVLARVQDPKVLRDRFERNARLFFHAPFGAKRKALPLAGRSAVKVTCGPKQPRVLLYFHGGGYIFGSPNTHWAMLARLCRNAQARAILPNYRKAPEHPHPAAITDARAAYLALLDSGMPASDVFMGGDSAGGGLALALLAEILTENLPKPAGCFAFSPLTDLTQSSPSLRANKTRDAILPAERVDDMVEMFLAGQSADDPRASPLFASFAGSPPIWITASDTEILRDDSRRLVTRLQDEGVDVTYVEQQDLPHVWPIFQTFLPEARDTLHQLATWITSRHRPPAES